MSIIYNKEGKNIFKSYEMYEDNKENKLMFNKKDVENTNHVLTKMLRHILYSKKITLKKFIEMHDRYMREINASSKDANYKKGNLLKALLKKDEITIKMFEYVLINILRMNITKMTYEFVDENGNEEKYTINCSF